MHYGFKTKINFRLKVISSIALLSLAMSCKNRDELLKDVGFMFRSEFT